MSLGLELRLRHHLAITPQLQQALRLLQLSSPEFAQEVEQALATNPFLEEDDDSPRHGTPPAPPAEAPPHEDAAAAARADVEADATADGGWQAIGTDGARSGMASDKDDDWTEWSPAPVSLHENLRQQLMLSPMSDRDRALAYLLIDEIGDTGYLETSLEELAAQVAPEDQVEPEELAALLKLVQQLDPPGIAARSLQECLLLQLAAVPQDHPGRAVALQLVGEHFELLARREFTHLQQLTGCNEAALHTARALIRCLDPKPGLLLGPDDTRYVVPDVLVSHVRGRWVAALNPAAQPRVRINRTYAEIAACRHGGESSFGRQLQEARWLLRHVEQRFTTIQRVADAIVARQSAFFEYGEAAMRPLVLKDIADELGLHESTVCRVTNDKYMATPRGLFEFKYFFSRQLVMDDGGACSGTAIRAVLKALIAAEDPKDPLSDAQLTRLLAEQGLRLARRTVTKYRGLMHVPSVELRRVAARRLQVRVASAEQPDFA
ncbi:RNA polymerase factor sigma-54 [Aromatoleum diolicum]|uniref:RNA polymerase sigma-54 factor n=1 Tax=Aromatoleum diolicum TaxID=75796 RepID=A0ABX1QEE5_9RHOO|nr:RNA polymerase factor sigma-54 [Aromatoleum diolicum]NMG75401.1 RNA polymerase factor sigma-54 [Aromatoleum diolicum]